MKTQNWTAVAIDENVMGFQSVYVNEVVASGRRALAFLQGATECT